MNDDVTQDEVIRKFQKHNKNRNKKNIDIQKVKASYQDFLDSFKQYKKNQEIKIGMLCKNHEKFPIN